MPPFDVAILAHARPPGRVAASEACFVLAVFCAALGCYKPSIRDGGFLCGPSNTCPEGLTCVQDHCYVRGSDKIPDAGPDARDGGPDMMCLPNTVPATGCVVKAGLACDPVCQTGCCSTQKCTALNVPVSGALTATLGCLPATQLRGLGDNCDPSNAGTADRSDNCLPGLVCVDGDVGAFCLKLCRDGDDCSDGTRCEQRPIDNGPGAASASVCGLPAATCVPTLGAPSGCPAGRTCYLVDTDPVKGDRTICEISAGEGRQTSCKYGHECYPGYTCATVGPGAGRCWPVCAFPGGSCPNVTKCEEVGQTYGYCY